SSRELSGLATETEPLDHHPATSQRQSLAAIMELERLVTGADLTGTILRFGSLYGPGATDAMARMVKKRLMPMIGGGTGITSWIHVEDAAGATLAALEKPTKGIFNVVDDDPASVSEWLPWMARVLGAKPPMRIPTWLGHLLAGDAAV